jgi:hypothetical protein
MEPKHFDINLVLPGVLGHEGDQIAIAVILEQLEPLGLSVGDSGLRTELSSAEPPLRFILELVQNPLVTGAAGGVAAKVYDAVLGEAVKAILNKLMASGKNGIASLYSALSERFPGRAIQIAIETPDQVNYPIGLDDAEVSVPKIAYDYAKERKGPRGSDRIYYNGEWMSPDEYFAPG